MSRQSHLPPRCPFQKKPVPPHIHESNPQIYKSTSQELFLEEQPSWLDDLLSDQDGNSKGTFHRRSASDSVTLLDGLVDSFTGLNSCNNEENSVGNEICSQLASSSMYGPNSPRRSGNVNFSENAIASALSEYVFQNPLQYVEGNLCISGMTLSDSKVDACGSGDELESKTIKRHYGQRSRVRKLQYIAELERTVNDLQTLESELAVRVASLLQTRVALSAENSKLKQQVVRLRQEKLILESKYKSMKKEAQRLRNCLPHSPTSKMRQFSGSSHLSNADKAEGKWQMFDMAKLNLN